MHASPASKQVPAVTAAALQIFEALGTPNENMWTGVERLAHYRSNFPQWQAKDWAVLVPRLAADPVGINLLASMLTYDPEARITAQEALKHPWFRDLGACAAAGSIPSSGRAISTNAAGAAAAAAAGPATGPLARLMHVPPQGIPGARPPPMPSMLGVPGRAGVSLAQQPLDHQLQVHHGLQQQQMLAESLAHIQQPHVQLQQPQAQLQQLHLQQTQQHSLHFQQQQVPMAAAVAVAAPAGLQAGCRNPQPACLWVPPRPTQHPAPGTAGAAPTPA